ncbi:MAG: TonB-dependent receptor [bacterium TMED46]|nr:MAG: TonB-dependent receptor [bacterium TMED46]
MKLFLFIFILLNIGFSQSSSLIGTIKDSKSQKPLVGANVFLINTSLGTASIDDGSYQISNVSPGVYILKATYIGYESKEIEISIPTGETIRQDLELGYKSIEGEPIEVTVQARGQMDAINKQLNASSIKNIISSDKIQELPDANAAEALARVPGLSIKREGGEGNKVIIRGLSPKYNKIKVNGTNLASTDADDRSTDLSMISQYMIEEIEVTKAGTPDQEADVLGGTVNFKLRKAEEGFHGSLITQGMYNGLKNTYDDYKIVMDISNRFFSNRLGIIAQLDMEKRNRSSHNLRASYHNTPADLSTVNPLNFYSLGLSEIIRDNDRNNNLLVIDYNIKNRILSYTSLNSTIRKDIISYGESYGITQHNGGRSLNSGNHDNTINVLTETWNYKQQFNPDLRIDIFNSFSSSKNGDTSKVFRFIQDEAFTEPLYNKNINTIQKFMIYDTNSIFFSGYDYVENKTKEKERSYGANLEYDYKITNYISGKLKFGFKIRKKSRFYDRDYEQGDFDRNSSYHAQMRQEALDLFDWLDGIENETSTVSMKYFKNDTYDDENFLNGNYSLGPFADLSKMGQLFSYMRKRWGGAQIDFNNFIHNFHKTSSLIYDYSGTENYFGRYLMTNLNLGAKLNFVTGVRFEDNKTSYTSYHGQSTVYPHFNSMGSDTVFNHVRNNAYLLPALFLKYQPIDWLVLRYATTKTLTRPNYSDMIPLYNISAQNRTVVYRNPFLEPGTSKNQDYVISFNNKYLGLLSFSYFTKRIQGLIFSSGQRVIENPNKYGLPEFSKYYMINDYKTNNEHDTFLKGMEVDFQTRFWYLPSFLRGLVFNANYTITRSKVRYPRTVIETEVIFNPSFEVVMNNLDSLYVDRLLDQPNSIINYSVGYDYKGFSGRLSMNYISNIFSSTNFWTELRQDTDAYTRYDLSIKQKLFIEGLEIYINASNLSEAIDVTRLRGFSLQDSNFDDSYYDAMLEEINSNGNANIDKMLNQIPRTQRSKGYEQHYGRTIDLGFRFLF